MRVRFEHSEMHIQPMIIFIAISPVQSRPFVGSLRLEMERIGAVMGGHGRRDHLMRIEK